MFSKLKKQSEGFTIIEVLIVLAIAGLIMLIVFLAVPALQRNSRNTGRNSDASLIAATVNECLSARNGVITSCQALSNDAVNLDLTRLNQLTDAPTYGAGTGSTTNATWQFGVKCTADGLGTQVGSTRQFVVRWRVETSNNTPTNRCLDS